MSALWLRVLAAVLGPHCAYSHLAAESIRLSLADEGGDEGS